VGATAARRTTPGTVPGRPLSGGRHARAGATPTAGRRLDGDVRLSTAVLAFGLLVFALPVPGTFLLGGAVLLLGVALRAFG